MGAGAFGAGKDCSGKAKKTGIPLEREWNRRGGYFFASARLNTHQKAGFPTLGKLKFSALETTMRWKKSKMLVVQTIETLFSADWETLEVGHPNLNGCANSVGLENDS